VLHEKNVFADDKDFDCAVTFHTAFTNRDIATLTARVAELEQENAKLLDEVKARRFTDERTDKLLDELEAEAVATIAGFDPMYSFVGQAEIDLGERVDEGNAPAESNQQFAARVVRERRSATGNNDDAGSAEAYARPVSPSILEFRIQTLTKENRDLRIRLKLAVRTVSAFEQLTQRLSAHIDKLNAIITDTCEAEENPYRHIRGELRRTANVRKRA
jgi:hypothetical protein